MNNQLYKENLDSRKERNLLGRIYRIVNWLLHCPKPGMGVTHELNTHDSLIDIAVAMSTSLALVASEIGQVFNLIFLKHSFRGLFWLCLVGV